jgi:hypothetical protein
VALADAVVADGDGHGALRAHEDDEALPARDRRVEEVTLEHQVVLGEKGNDDGGVFAPLALVD